MLFRVGAKFAACAVLQLSIWLLPVPLAYGQAPPCYHTNATLVPCINASDAASFLTGNSSSIAVNNATWIGPNCVKSASLSGAPGFRFSGPYGKITSFGPCHYYKDDMPGGALVMGTGWASAAANVNNSGPYATSHKDYGYAQLDDDLKLLALDKYNSQDLHDTLALVIEFTPTKTGDLQFQYVFGSDEYPNFAPGGISFNSNTSYNDLFAFYVWKSAIPSNKTNIAKLPNSDIPVSIFSVNIVNKTYFNPNHAVLLPDNTTADSPNYPIAMNGLSQVLRTSHYGVVAGTKYSVKLVIADMGDGYYDSVVYIKAGSLTFSDPIDVNCSATWSDWSKCLASCGTSFKSRIYNIKAYPELNGKPCEHENAYVETVPCDTGIPCPVNCTGYWGNWTTCPACGTANQSRTFTVTQPAVGAGTNCTAYNGQVETRACNISMCPVNCTGEWVPIGNCSKSCGNGTQSVRFNVTTQAAYGGVNCSWPNGTVQNQTCNPQVCPVNCTGYWGNWTACPTCGTANQSRTYVVTQAAVGNGTNCTANNGQVETRACNISACAVNCSGYWSNWTTCPACGTANQTRTYIVTQPAVGIGTSCTANNGQVETRTCNISVCPVKCTGYWSNWTTCPACGSANQSRTYIVTQPAVGTGTNCTANNGQVQTRTCNISACPPSPSPSTAPPTPPATPSPSPTPAPVPPSPSPTPAPATPGPPPTPAPVTPGPPPTPAPVPPSPSPEPPSPSPAAPVPTPPPSTDPASPSPTPDPPAATPDPQAPTPDPPAPTPDPPGPAPDSPAPTPDPPGPAPDSPGPAPDSPAPTPDPPGPAPDSPGPAPDSPGPAPDSPGPAPDSPGPAPDSPAPTPDPPGPAPDSPGPAPDSPGPAPDSPGPAPDSPGPAPDSPGPAPDSPGPAPDSPGPAPDSPGPAPDSPGPAPDSPGPAQDSPGPAQDSPGPAQDSPGPAPESPSPAPAGPVPTPSPAAASPIPTPTPGGAPTPASPSPSPKPPSPSPSPQPKSPSPSPQAKSPSPSPRPSPSPSPSPPAALPPLNQTLLQELPYYIGPSVLPPLPPMEDTNITIRGGNVSITGVKIETGPATVNTSKETTAGSELTGSTPLQANLTLRWAAFNGSLGFYTLGVNIMVFGEFVLQRTMNWTWNSQYSAWTTQVAIVGKFKLTREEEINGVMVGTETLEPGVDGGLTLYSAIYPGPGFSGTYDWAGDLDMNPDPFVYWGIPTLNSLNYKASGRRLQEGRDSKEQEQCCPYDHGRTLLQTLAAGNLPVQGRVSVREVNNKATSGSNTTSSDGSRAAVDDEISIAMPDGGISASPSPGGSTGSVSHSGIFAPLVAAWQKNPRLIIVLAAVVAPSMVALCTASIIGAVLYRRKKRKEREEKRQQQRLAQQLENEDALAAAAAAELAAVGGTPATSAPSRKGRKKRSLKGKGKGPARLSSSGEGDAKTQGSAEPSVEGPAATNQIEMLDPADQLASFTGYPNLRQRRRISNPTPVDSEDGQVIRLDPANMSVSGDGGTSPKTKPRGRFGSITGSIAGMASSVAGAINNAFRSSQAGHAYKVISTDEANTSNHPGVRGMLRLPSEVTTRGPTLPGAQSSPKESHGRRFGELGKQGSLDLNAYPGAQKAAGTVDWGSAGVFLNSSGQAKVTPPASSSQIKLTPPATAQRELRPRQNPQKTVPAQWTLPTLDAAGAQSKNAAWATGVAAAWAAEIQAASRGPTPPGGAGAQLDDDSDEVVTGGSTFLLPSRSRRFVPGK